MPRGAGRHDRRPVPPGVPVLRRTVRSYYPLAYDAAGSRGPTNWKNYYPGAPLVDVVAVDYYATAFVRGITLDTIVAIAGNASPPKPFGSFSSDYREPLWDGLVSATS